MNSKIARYFMLMLSVLAFKANAYVGGIGNTADNAMVPISVASNLVGSICVTIGICCFVAALIKYMQYRVNPIASPIGNVIVLLISSVILVLLPLIYIYAQGGIPFDLFN